MIERYLMSDGDIQLSEHFKLHEFQSRNGCNEVFIDDALIDLLEKVFRVSGATSATVNDGYREPGAYCRSIGGLDKDAHAYGMAADMVYSNSDGIISGKRIACIAQDLGCEGIGYMGNAVHLDTRGNGGYRNTHWYGDETTGRTVSDWHDYFGIDERFFDTEDNTVDNVEDNINSSDNDVNDNLTFDGGDMMNRDISREQLKYEVNRYALTVLGREIGDADTYVELLSTGQIDWYEFNKRLQESEEGVKRWIKYTLFIDILGRIPEQSEIDWWYAQYSIRYEINKALMAERFKEDYDAFKGEYINKPL